MSILTLYSDHWPIHCISQHHLNNGFDFKTFMDIALELLFWRNNFIYKLVSSINEEDEQSAGNLIIRKGYDLGKTISELYQPGEDHLEVLLIWGKPHPEHMEINHSKSRLIRSKSLTNSVNLEKITSKLSQSGANHFNIGPFEVHHSKNWLIGGRLLQGLEYWSKPSQGHIMANHFQTPFEEKNSNTQ